MSKKKKMSWQINKAFSKCYTSWVFTFSGDEYFSVVARGGENINCQQVIEQPRFIEWRSEWWLSFQVQISRRSTVSQNTDFFKWNEMDTQTLKMDLISMGDCLLGGTSLFSWINWTAEYCFIVPFGDLDNVLLGNTGSSVSCTNYLNMTED